VIPPLAFCGGKDTGGVIAGLTVAAAGERLVCAALMLEFNVSARSISVSVT
jgi:hypothetical protein